ncbi:MAG: glycosyltransferase family 2 protein [Candidatus Eisenbacteria bacterium]|uniref:Glycosyltransferase family 2 protein n=1 Tax=Eiseniibacteriota bacterium TaxID=2212470 RepID=A0A9D6QJ03_UNCEI|nr:glycosyltransferase family 2 protein [Candidatus Eisenbacteria bacterium]MBI3540007.1 glycosyltransferase family 2 protein [Candidatus Eisenbacteria bacterium]
MELSVVIVHYRSREPLLECLAALEADAAGITHEIVIVDNDPEKGAIAAAAARFPQVRGIANDENIGYARAINQGIAATTGDVVMAMNPDCVIEPGSLAALLGHLHVHGRTAIVGPRIVDSDGTLQLSARAFPDHLTFLFNRYSLLTRLFPGNPWSRRYLLTDWDHASVRDVDWLSGACMLVRRAAIRQVGGMDERFFMFNEDVDWCRRMKLAGWAVTYVPGAQVIHHIGASRRKVAARVIVERHRGMIHYFHKHHPSHPVVAALADTMIMLRAGLMLTANAFRRP